MVEAQVISAIAEHIARQFDPQRIVLFGSHARGEAGPRSDVDLLVVLDKVSDKRQIAVAIRRSLSGFHVAKDIVVTTPEEIERRGNLVGAILRPALRDGRVLYERGR